MRAIDLFAGAGGSSTGMTAAGWRVLWAANHWADAVRVHRLNHPGTEHSVQDLQQADFGLLPAHDVMWASPSCKGHSDAASGGGRYLKRGTAPSHDFLRSTSWAAVTAAEVCRPQIAIIENVVRLRKWELWGPWCAAWRALGYSLSEQVVNAADCGVAQDRPRLFVIAVRGNTPFNLEPPTMERPGMRDVLDPYAGEFRRVRDCATGIRTRVKRAIDRHGFTGPFHTQSVSDNSGRSLDLPSPVVTTKHQHGLVRGRGAWGNRWYRPVTADEYRALMGFPASYKLGGAGVSKACVLLGNAVCPPVATFIARQIEERI